MSVNMQEINSKLRIMGWIMEGTINFKVFSFDNVQFIHDELALARLELKALGVKLQYSLPPI